ncbi:MAG: cytochrome c biogenesis protein CcdA, partial [Planctomycetota bacterium]
MAKLVFSSLLTFFLSPLLFGQFGSFGTDDPFSASSTDPINAEIRLDCQAVPPGDSFRVALVISVEKGWHIYANPKGPGIGKATVVTGENQPGFRFKPALYLPGEKITQEDLGPGDWVYAYEGTVPVFLEVTTDADLKPGEYQLGVHAEILACKESCQPFDKELSFTLRVLEAGKKAIDAEDPVFDRFDEAAPAPPTTGAKSLKPASDEGVAAAGEPAGDFTMYRSRELESGKGIADIWMAILFGFLAGMLLNVMPCVLPVVSIKIMSLVSQAHESKGRILGLGLAFSGGILAVFLVLAGFAAGVGMSWGAQFQSETFIVVMLSLVFVFALGMFDVYLIIVPGGSGGHNVKEGYTGSFLKGVLATFLATPCSGPFLGATLAWALSQSPLVIFLVFTSIWLGMAFPYVVLTAMPGLLRFVPKPGLWM